MTDEIKGVTPEAHELGAVLRMLRTGWPKPRLMQVFGVSDVQLGHMIKLAEGEERDAVMFGLPIYGGPDAGQACIPAVVPERKGMYIRAKDIQPGDEISHVGIVTKAVQTGYTYVFVLQDGKEVRYRDIDELLIRRVV